MVTVVLRSTGSSFFSFDKVYESLETTFIVELAIVYVPNGSVGTESDLRSEAIIGVGWPAGGVAFQGDGIGFSAMVLVASNVRRMVV